MIAYTKKLTECLRSPVRPESVLAKGQRDEESARVQVRVQVDTSAFYGNQFGLAFPVFVHYGVQLLLREVGGAVDPAPTLAIHGRRGLSPHRF